MTGRARTKRAKSHDLRIRALRALRRFGPMTADECAETLGTTPFSLRPRFTELRVEGYIDATDVRRENASGRTAQVWKLA